MEKQFLFKASLSLTEIHFCDLVAFEALANWTSYIMFKFCVVTCGTRSIYVVQKITKGFSDDCQEKQFVNSLP